MGAGDDDRHAAVEPAIIKSASSVNQMHRNVDADHTYLHQTALKHGCGS